MNDKLTKTAELDSTSYLDSIVLACIVESDLALQPPCSNNLVPMLTVKCARPLCVCMWLYSFWYLDLAEP